MLKIMKLKSIIKWVIPTALIISFAVLLFIALYDQSTSCVVKQDYTDRMPQATMNLKDVILLEWDKEVLEISKAHPGGKLTQRKFEGREMNVYWINTILADVDSNAKISFQRNENNSGEFVTHRTVQLEMNSTDEIENKYEQINSILNSYGRKIMNIGKSKYMDSTFHLEDVDGLGGFQLDFRKDLKSMTIRIDVTRYEIISETTEARHDAKR